jgi:hypothetical protein
LPLDGRSFCSSIMIHPSHKMIKNYPSKIWYISYLTPEALPPRLFPRMLASLGCAPQRLLPQGLSPTGHLSPCWPPGLDTPCASTSLVATRVQEWPKVIFLTHATIVLDHISATVTYVMWCGEHLVSVSKEYTFPILLNVKMCSNVAMTQFDPPSHKHFAYSFRCHTEEIWYCSRSDHNSPVMVMYQTKYNI